MILNGADELTIKFDKMGAVNIEVLCEKTKITKYISIEDFVDCFKDSIAEKAQNSGLLPSNCIAYNCNDVGNKRICFLFPENKIDFTYYKTTYENFPLPKLIFGFSVNKTGQIYQCTVGVLPNDAALKPTQMLYRYPFSNVSSKFYICTGNNILPKYDELYKLSTLPNLILSYPNNNDHFSSTNNQLNMGMRELLETLKDKPTEYYYSDVLVPLDGFYLNDFINMEF